MGVSGGARARGAMGSERGKYVRGGGAAISLALTLGAPVLLDQVKQVFNATQHADEE